MKITPSQRNIILSKGVVILVIVRSAPERNININPIKNSSAPLIKP